MTDDRLNKIRKHAEECANFPRTRITMLMDPRDVLAMLDMIDRLRAEIESSQERTVEELCGS